MLHHDVEDLEDKLAFADVDYVWSLYDTRDLVGLLGASVFLASRRITARIPKNHSNALQLADGPLSVWAHVSAADHNFLLQQFDGQVLLHPQEIDPKRKRKFYSIAVFLRSNLLPFFFSFAFHRKLPCSSFRPRSHTCFCPSTAGNWHTDRVGALLRNEGQRC